MESNLVRLFNSNNNDNCWSNNMANVNMTAKDKIILCKNCNCMTHNKKGYIYICGKCGKDRRKNGKI